VADDPGVMGNLPRSRPGRRSEKRSTGASGRGRKPAGAGSTPARTAAAPSSSGEGGAPARPAPAPRSARKPSTGRGSTTAARAERAAARAGAGGPDPVGDALKVAGKLAGAGLGIAAEVLRRLPRP